PPSIDIEPAVKPNNGGMFNTFANEILIRFWKTARKPQNIKYKISTFPPKRNNFKEAPNPIVVKNASIKKFCINSESSLIVMIFVDCNIATKIEKIKPPITGAGIQSLLNIEIWLTIYIPKRYNKLAIAKVVIASSSSIFNPP